MSASSNLTTVDKVKSYLGINSSDDDGVLTSLLAAASEAIEHYCSREFAQKQRTEIYDGHGSSCLILKNRPITSVAAVYDDHSGDFDSTSLIAPFRYTFYPDEGVLRLYSTLFSRGIRNIKIVYTAGYSVIPPAVEQAANILVAHFYHRGRQGADAVESESMGAYTVSYDTSEWPHQVRSLLNEFREVRI